MLYLMAILTRPVSSAKQCGISGSCASIPLELGMFAVLDAVSIVFGYSHLHCWQSLDCVLKETTHA